MKIFDLFYYKLVQNVKAEPNSHKNGTNSRKTYNK